MKKQNLTTEFKQETLNTLERVFYDINSINVVLANDYNRENWRIEFLLQNLRIINNLIDITSCVLKDKHTIIGNENEKFVDFNVKTNNYE